MDRGTHTSALILPGTLARILFVSGLLLACAQLSARAQHAHGAPGYTDPEQLAIVAARKKLDQDEKNIAVRQTGIAEFESRAQTIRRQLEALSFMAESDMPSRLREYASKLNTELKALEQHIEIMKRCIAAETQLLEADLSQLYRQEERYKENFAADRWQVEKSLGDEYRDRIEQRNARLREEATQPQAQIALQNQRLMQEVEAPSRSGQGPPGVPIPPTGDSYDGDELRLCEALEQKVAEKDYDIAEINLLAAKGLPGAENLDVDKALKTLDLWAAWVRHETDRHLYKFQEAPGEYNTSEAYFRILMMICTLQEDFRVCYNKDPKMRAGPVELVPNDFTFFGNPKDLFVHGVTEGEHEGTCAFYTSPSAGGWAIL